MFSATHVRTILYLLFCYLLLSQSTLSSAPDIVIGNNYKLVKTKPWPIEARRKIGIELYETLIDQEPAVRMVFNCSNTYMLLTFHGQWKKVSNYSSRYSCQLAEFGNHNLKLSISEFHNGELLESLDDEQWAGYKKYLDRRFPKTITFYEEDGTGSDRVLSVFGEKYRQIAYSYKSSQNVVTKAREVFVFLNEVLYVFTFSGPSESFDKQWNQQSFYISRLRLEAKNTKATKTNKPPVTIR